MYPTTIQADNAELRDRIVRFLHLRGLPAADSVRLHVDGGVATISGWHSSAKDRDVLLDCCRHVAGVVRVVDASAVRRDAREMSRQATPAPDSRNRAESDRMPAAAASY